MSNSTLKYIGKRLVISLITLFVILMVLLSELVTNKIREKDM